MESVASARPLCEVVDPARHHERRGGVEDPDVAAGALLALEHGADHAGVERGVAAAQVRHRRRGQAERPGSTRHSVTSNAPLPSPRTSRTLEGDVTLSSSSPSSACTISVRRLPVAPKTPAMIGAMAGSLTPDQLVPGPGRVDQRTRGS